MARAGEDDPHGTPLRETDPRHVGRYRLLRRLGEGGMGVVYLGATPSGERVAVKLIRDRFVSEPGFRRRFQREVAAARRVARFCTAAVLDADVHAETAYLVTEYVPGRTLLETVRDDGPLRGSSLDGLAVSIATALRAVHAAGIVHRDLKPGNVLLSPVGPKVIDFGVAQIADSAGQPSSVIIGTPAFMAPEQLDGGEPTAAGDIFAWGGTIAYAATGRAPFGTGPLPAVVYRVVHDEPDLTGLDDPLRGLVARALAKDPAERPTVAEILDTLTARPGTPVASAAAPGTSPDRTRADTASPPAGPVPGGIVRRRRLRLLSGLGSIALALAVAYLASRIGTGSTADAGPQRPPVAASGSATPSPGAATGTATTRPRPAGPGGNPLREPGVRFAYLPDEQARRQADIWAGQGRHDDAALMRALARVPHPVWLMRRTTDVERTVAATVGLAARHDAVPVFVTSGVPRRDCGPKSGVASEQAYRAWIDEIAAGIGAGRAVVALEPNSLTRLPGTDSCPLGGAKAQAERYRELRYAVVRLGSLPHTAVYLDGGIDGWPRYDTMADRLVHAGVAQADGFYLNVSDYQPTPQLLTYGGRLSRCIHLKATGAGPCVSAAVAAVPGTVPLTHFVIDTSRNGRGVWNPPEGTYAKEQAWCNPPGRGVGARPTTDTGDELADALLWLQHPGRSNGRCTRGTKGGKDPVYGRVDPAPGAWWPELALERAKNAVPPLR